MQNKDKKSPGTADTTTKSELNKNKKSSGTANITMKSELKKVIWPTASQTAKSTAVTIIFVIIVSAILIVLNFAFDFVSEAYYNAILGTGEHSHGETLSGDVSGDSDEIGDLLLSGEESGEVSGENLDEVASTVSGE